LGLRGMSRTSLLRVARFSGMCLANAEFCTPIEKPQNSLWAKTSHFS
jgi:hypothetical protein